MALINNLSTLGSVPLASVSNLEDVLGEVASRMDREEDVLFLFLTSHGSEQHVFSVEFGPLNLNDLTPEGLKRVLDDSGIKWRVIVISACYSGGFIEALKDDFTLVMTAARADRTSFGCSNENDFTYFGRAYFDEQLRRQRSFINAFYDARDAVQSWEDAEDLPSSLPQIHVGAGIAPKLDALEARLNGQ